MAEGKRIYMKWPDGHFGYLYITDDDKLIMNGMEISPEEAYATRGVAVAKDPAFKARLERLGVRTETPKSAVKIVSVSLTEENVKASKVSLHDMTVMHPSNPALKSLSSIINIMVGALNSCPESFAQLIEMAQQRDVPPEVFLANAVTEKLASLRAPSSQPDPET